MISGEEEMIKEIKNILDGKGTVNGKLMDICILLDRKVDHYNWTGFYLVDQERERTLVLGPYVGEPTDHVTIPFGNGICGQAADSGELFLVQDVLKNDDYLPCSPDVRSEIVVPIFMGGTMLGELDIDSHDLSAFSPRDSIFLQKICDLIAPILHDQG